MAGRLRNTPLSDRTSEDPHSSHFSSRARLDQQRTRVLDKFYPWEAGWQYGLSNRQDGIRKEAKAYEYDKTIAYTGISRGGRLPISSESFDAGRP